jgi:hypothetical protein
MPTYLERLQFIEDSTRAYRWFDMTKDSSYIRKFLNRSYHGAPVQDEPVKKVAAVLPANNNQNSPVKSSRKAVGISVPSGRSKENGNLLINGSRVYGTRQRVIKTGAA